MLIVLIDDLRSFLDGRDAKVARNSKDGISLLNALKGQRIDQLWLDHDLGGDDTITPVVYILEEAAFLGEPWDIGEILVHSANPVGAARTIQGLNKAGYPTKREYTHWFTA
jgi:hypothetical protein